MDGIKECELCIIQNYYTSDEGISHGDNGGSKKGILERVFHIADMLSAAS